MENLDGLDAGDLLAFWAKHQRGWAYRELFPDARPGRIIATRDLADYAANKAAAMGCRERGDIERALMYERICERIYGALPTWARW